MSNTADPLNTGGTRPSSSEQVDRMAQKTHETVDKVAESAAKAEQQLRDKAAQAEAKFAEVSAGAREAAQENIDHLQAYVQENPLKSAGIAFAAGAVLAALLRR